VPGSAVWTFGKGHVGEFSPRRVIRTIRGPKWPKERSPGFTLGGSPHPNSPEGATRYGDNRPERLNRIACAFPAPSASGRNVYLRLTQGKPGVYPGLSYFGHFGPRIENVQTPDPGTSCLAAISLSLRDKSRFPIETPQNYQRLWELSP
jgi:hypothetical protein